MVGTTARRPAAAGLSLERSRDRLSAYVYGNILVLSAIATVSPEMVADGHGVLVVLATTLTTYLAHVVAHSVGASLGVRSPEEGRLHARALLRDAVPIVSSGSAPAVVMALGWWGVLDDRAAVLLAGAVVVVRLAGMGVATARLGGQPASRRQVVAGLVLAAISGVVVVLKVWLLH